jgi:tetratricopeptide (TPR) repeat protein
MDMICSADRKNGLLSRGAVCEAARKTGVRDLPVSGRVRDTLKSLMPSRHPLPAVIFAVVILALAGNLSRGEDAVPAGKKPSTPPSQPGAAEQSSGKTSPANSKAASPNTAVFAQADIQRAIADLANADFVVRERASQALWNAGRAAEPALEKIVEESDDYEVVYRARQILQSFQLGIYPDTPAETVTIIVRFRSGNFYTKRSIIQNLYAEGKTDLLRRLIAKEPNPNYREQLNQVFSSAISGDLYGRGRRRRGLDPAELALMARQRLALGDFDGAERLLLLSGGGNDFSARDYAALMLGRGKLDAAIAQLRANLPPTDEAGQRRLAWMLRTKGDLGGAVAAARLAKDDALVENLQLEAADWKALAKIDAKTDVDSLADVPNGSARLARIIAFRHLAGETQACELASVAAAKALKQPRGRDRRLLSALVLTDRAGRVVELASNDDIRLAFGLLVAQSRLQEAFRLAKIEVPIPAKIDWPTWLREGKKEVAPDRVLFAHQVARALHLAGEEEQAHGLISAMLAVYREKVPNESWEILALDLMELELRYGRSDAGDALAAKLLAMNLKDPDAVISTLYRDQDAIATMLWKVLRKKFPGEDRPAALKHLRRLLADRPDRAAVGELVILLPLLDPLLDAPAPEAASDDEASNPRALKLLALATLLHRNGQGKLAVKYLARIPLSGVTAQVLIDQGNLYAEEKEWGDAIKSYTAACGKDRKSASAYYLLGWAETKHGDETGGRKRMEQALLIPLGDGDSRHDLVQTLVRLHQDEEAARQRLWIPRLAAPHDRAIVQSLMETGDLAAEKGDDANMATLWQRVGVELLSGGVALTEMRYYLQPPFSAHSARARELLRAGKTAEAIQEVHQAEASEPANLQLALDCDADLRKHGAAGEADALYRRMLERHETLCRDFPKSGTFHNDLAWLAANLDRDLDKALAHAQRATELEPQAASVLDTLAEVQFRRGNQAEALRLAKRCIELEPDRTHYQKQIARFALGRQ